MSGKLFRESRGGFRGWTLAAVLCLAAGAGASRAQTGPSVPAPAPTPSAPSAPNVDGNIVQAGCAACAGGVLGLQPPALPEVGGGCATCGAGAGPGCGCSCGCYPGRQPCDCCCDDSTYFGRLFGGIYHCICCPDPCYEGHWCALADASFFQTSGPRPETQMRLKLEDAFHMPFPDKSEFFWARADGKGKGPMPAAPIVAPNDINYREFHMINEAGIGKFSASIDLPFREVHPDDPYKMLPSNGFGDMVIGTKSMLLDCELLQFSFEFNTFVPTGNFLRGLGTGHVSLEPGFLWALKLAPEWYLQNELALRIPIGGDPAYQGNVFHYHFSLNHTLWNCGHGVVVVGTAELNGWDFINGKFTNTGNVPTSVGDPFGDVVNMGPGVRLVICDKIDFGIASYFNVTGGSIADEFLQAEFRWRF